MWAQIIWSIVASILVSIVMRQRMKVPRPKAQELDFPTAEEGRPIPVVFGTREVKSPNVVWVGDRQNVTYVSQGGGVFYYAGLHMVVCHGVCDNIRRFIVDGKNVPVLVTAGSPVKYTVIEGMPIAEANATVELYGPYIFGGKRGAGGISGDVDILFGATTQTQNAYLQAQNGTDIPAFRGVMSVVLNQCYLGNTPFIRPWSFEVQRIHKTESGAAQWYDAKAQINTEISAVEEDWSLIATDTNPLGDFFPASAYVFDSLIIRKPAGLTYQAWSPFANDADNGGLTWTNRFTFSVISDTYTYWDDAYYATAAAAEAAYADEVVIISAYGVVNTGFYLNLTENYLSRANNRGGLSLNIYAANQADMNPAHVIREYLTSDVYGLAADAADIDSTSFEAAADTFSTEQLGVSMIVDTRNTVEDALADVLAHCGAVLFTDISTGKFKLKPIRDDYTLSDTLTLDNTIVIRVVKASRPTFSELVNSVTVSYMDYKTRSIKTVSAQDHALVSAMGSVVDNKVEYLGFSCPETASRVALRDLTTLSSQLLNMSIECTRAAAVLQIGDVFIADLPDDYINGVVMRVQKITYGTASDNTVKIDAIEDVFSLTTYGVTSTQDPLGLPAIPADIPDAAVGEAPYWFLANEYGQATANALLGGTTTYGAVFVSAANPGGQDGATITEDDDDTASLTFCASAELDGHVTDRLATTIQITNWDSGISLVEAGSLAYLDGEWLRVDSVDTGTDSSITVGRGCLDTFPDTHSDSNGGVILFVGGAYTVTDTQYVSGDSPDVKLLTRVDGAELNPEFATTYPVTMASRGVRPYPPGNVTIEGEYWPTDLAGVGSIEILWAHRNRQSLTVNDFVDSDNGPEAGTTYTVQLYDADSASDAWYEATGITGTSHTVDFAVDVPPTGIVNLKTVLTAVRGGYDSWQSFECTSLFEEPVTLAEVQALTGVYDIWIPYETTSLFTTDVSAVNVAVNGTVGRMESLATGSTRDFTQSVSGDRPTLRQSGARYYLEFDGVNDYMVVAASTALYKFMHDDTGGYALAAVSFGTTSNPDKNYTLLSTDATASANVGFTMRYDDRASVPRNNAFVTDSSRGVGGQFTYLSSTDNAITPNATHVVEYGVGASSAPHVVDGATVATGTKLYTESTASSTHILHMGATPGGTGHAVMKLYGVIMFDATPSAGDLLTARKYLAQRAGVSL